jgi:virulence-associated protein VagC
MEPMKIFAAIAEDNIGHAPAKVHLPTDRLAPFKFNSGLIMEPLHMQEAIAIAKQNRMLQESNRLIREAILREQSRLVLEPGLQESHSLPSQVTLAKLNARTSI